MVNLPEIIDRAKEIGRFASNKEFAEKLGLSAPDFSKRKRTGTLLPLIIEWGVAEKVNLDWLVRGIPYNQVAEPENNYGNGLIKDLDEIKQIDINQYYRMRSYIRGALDTLKQIRKDKG